MLNTSIIPARNLQKLYKSIIEGVKAKRNAVVLTTNNKPQAALISLEDLEELKRVKMKHAGLEMLKLARDNEGELKNLPSNLRDNANDILYSSRYD